MRQQLKDRKSSSELCEQTRSVKEKSINRLWLWSLVWPSVFVFLFNFKLLCNNFLIWSVPGFGRDLADLLDLWTAGGNFCWNSFFFFKYSWGASYYCFTREADLENCLVPLPPPSFPSSWGSESFIAILVINYSSLWWYMFWWELLHAPVFI